jgi:hypothetical protein
MKNKLKTRRAAAKRYQKTKTGKISKKPRKVNYNVVVGSYNKELGFIPNEYGLKFGYSKDENIPTDTAMAQTAVLNVEKFKNVYASLEDLGAYP